MGSPFLDIELQWRALCTNPDEFIENRNLMVPKAQFDKSCGSHGEAEVRLVFFRSTVELFKKPIVNGCYVSKTADMLIGFISPEQDTTCSLKFPERDIEISIILPRGIATRIIDNSFIPLRYGRPIVTSVIPVIAIYAILSLENSERKRFLESAWYFWQPASKPSKCAIC